METISREGRPNPELEEQRGFDPLGARPRGHFTPGKQRPKTALATMRVPRDLEFSPRDESRSNQDMVGSLVISSFEFRYSLTRNFGNIERIYKMSHQLICVQFTVCLILVQSI